MTPRRALVAAALGAATLVPAPAAVASCHACFAPVDCAEAVCEPLYEALAGVESRESHNAVHTACQAVEDVAPWLVACHD